MGSQLVKNVKVFNDIFSMNNAINGGASLMNEFFDFLKKFGVVGLAIGVVVGGAVKTFVDEIVKTVVTPILNYVLGLIGFSPTGGINLPQLKATDQVQTILIGQLLGALINFAVLMFIVFVAVKFFISKFMHEDEKKAAGM